MSDDDQLQFIQAHSSNRSCEEKGVAREKAGKEIKKIDPLD